MAPARSHQDAEQRSRTITNTQAQQDSTNPEIIPSTEQATNTKPISTNTIGGLSYAQVTSQPTHTDNQYHGNNNNDTEEIKELLKQSIKNTEILTRIISEQNAVLRQQTQQITVMLQLIIIRAKQKIKTDTLKIAAWISNGLQQRALEIKTFIYNNNIDILLVSETHFTTKSFLKIPYYTIYMIPNTPQEKLTEGQQ